MASLIRTHPLVPLVFGALLLITPLLQSAEADVPRSSVLHNVPELRFSIQKTWYGTPRGGPAYNFTIHQESNGEIPVLLEAPFYNEPEAPRSTRMGGFLGLLNFEAFEMQFIGADNRCLHVIVGPAGHYLIFLMNNEHLNIKDDLHMAYDSKVSYVPPYWRATIKIPLDYFPKDVQKFNAATRHGAGNRRNMDVLYINDEPLPSYFASPPFRTAQKISFEKVLLTYDNSKMSSVWRRAIEDYRNAPRDGASPQTQSSLLPSSLGAALFLAYTLAYIVFIIFM